MVKLARQFFVDCIRGLLALILLAALVGLAGYLAWQLMPLHPDDGSYAGKNMVAFLARMVVFGFVAAPLTQRVLP